MRVSPASRWISATVILAALTLIGSADEGERGQTVESRAPQIPLSAEAQRLVPELQALIASELTQRFGDGVTFVHSEKLPIEFGLEAPDQNREQGWLLRLGRQVFVKHCAECHGRFGDGQAVTEQKLRSAPRDFRSGIFKWKSTVSQNRARRHDLYETIRLGLPGTDMPGFPSVTDDERRGAVEYVRWLSMRHEVESEVVIRAENANLDEVRADFNKWFTRITDAWSRAELPESVAKAQIEPVLTADRIEKGKALFTSNKTRCSACHGTDGRGDGPATKDFWFIPASNKKYSTAGIHDAWGNKVTPRDFRSQSFRSGEDALDVFRRISVGIPGTPMPGYGPGITEDDKWNLVAYVLSLRPAKIDAVHRDPSPKSQSTSPNVP